MFGNNAPTPEDDVNFSEWLVSQSEGDDSEVEAQSRFEPGHGPGSGSEGDCPTPRPTSPGSPTPTPSEAAPADAPANAPESDKAEHEDDALGADTLYEWVQEMPKKLVPLFMRVFGKPPEEAWKTWKPRMEKQPSLKRWLATQGWLRDAAARRRVEAILSEYHLPDPRDLANGSAEDEAYSTLPAWHYTNEEIEHIRRLMSEKVYFENYAQNRDNPNSPKFFVLDWTFLYRTKAKGWILDPGRPALRRDAYTGKSDITIRDVYRRLPRFGPPPKIAFLTAQKVVEEQAAAKKKKALSLRGGPNDPFTSLGMGPRPNGAGPPQVVPRNTQAFVEGEKVNSGHHDTLMDWSVDEPEPVDAPSEPPPGPSMSRFRQKVPEASEDASQKKKKEGTRGKDKASRKKRADRPKVTDGSKSHSSTKAPESAEASEDAPHSRRSRGKGKEPRKKKGASAKATNGSESHSSTDASSSSEPSASQAEGITPEEPMANLSLQDKGKAPAHDKSAQDMRYEPDDEDDHMVTQPFESPLGLLTSKRIWPPNTDHIAEFDFDSFLDYKATVGRTAQARAEASAKASAEASAEATPNGRRERRPLPNERPKAGLPFPSRPGAFDQQVFVVEQPNNPNSSNSQAPPGSQEGTPNVGPNLMPPLSDVQDGTFFSSGGAEFRDVDGRYFPASDNGNRRHLSNPHWPTSQNSQPRRTSASLPTPVNTAASSRSAASSQTQRPAATPSGSSNRAPLPQRGSSSHAQLDTRTASEETSPDRPLGLSHSSSGHNNRVAQAQARQSSQHARRQAAQPGMVPSHGAPGPSGTHGTTQVSSSSSSNVRTAGVKRTRDDMLSVEDMSQNNRNTNANANANVAVQGQSRSQSKPSSKGKEVDRGQQHAADASQAGSSLHAHPLSQVQTITYSEPAARAAPQPASQHTQHITQPAVGNPLGNHSRFPFTAAFAKPVWNYYGTPLDGPGADTRSIPIHPHQNPETSQTSQTSQTPQMPQTSQTPEMSQMPQMPQMPQVQMPSGGFDFDFTGSQQFQYTTTFTQQAPMPQAPQESTPTYPFSYGSQEQMMPMGYGYDNYMGGQEPYQSAPGHYQTEADDPDNAPVPGSPEAEVSGGHHVAASAQQLQSAGQLPPQQSFSAQTPQHSQNYTSIPEPDSYYHQQSNEEEEEEEEEEEKEASSLSCLVEPPHRPSQDQDEDNSQSGRRVRQRQDGGSSDRAGTAALSSSSSQPSQPLQSQTSEPQWPSTWYWPTGLGLSLSLQASQIPQPSRRSRLSAWSWPPNLPPPQDPDLSCDEPAFASPAPAYPQCGASIFDMSAHAWLSQRSAFHIPASDYGGDGLMPVPMTLWLPAAADSPPPPSPTSVWSTPSPVPDPFAIPSPTPADAPSPPASPRTITSSPWSTRPPTPIKIERSPSPMSLRWSPTPEPLPITDSIEQSPPPESPVYTPDSPSYTPQSPMLPWAPMTEPSSSPVYAPQSPTFYEQAPSPMSDVLSSLSFEIWSDNPQETADASPTPVSAEASPFPGPSGDLDEEMPLSAWQPDEWTDPESSWQAAAQHPSLTPPASPPPPLLPFAQHQPPVGPYPSPPASPQPAHYAAPPLSPAPAADADAAVQISHTLLLASSWRPPSPEGRPPLAEIDDPEPLTPYYYCAHRDCASDPPLFPRLLDLFAHEAAAHGL